MAIASHVGYKNLKHIAAIDFLPADGVWADNPKHPPHSLPRIKVPDYTNSLEDMHAIEVWAWPTGKEDGEATYRHNLNTVTDYRAYHATAAQRAEAFIKTIGKWEA